MVSQHTASQHKQTIKWEPRGHKRGGSVVGMWCILSALDEGMLTVELDSAWHLSTYDKIDIRQSNTPTPVGLELSGGYYPDGWRGVVEAMR